MLSAVLPVLEQMGVQVVDERPVPDQTRWRPERVGVRLRPATGPMASTLMNGCATSSSPPSARCGGARRRTTASTASSSSPACRRPTSRSCGPTPSTSARSAPPSASRYIESTLAAHPALATALVELFRTRFVPHFDGNRALECDGIAAEVVAALERGREPRRGPDRAGVPPPRAGHDAHERLPARQRRPAAAVPVAQARPGAGAGPAAASAGLRDLGVRAARRGGPPQRRSGGARRHPLERPPRGLPHRGPGADEGADGEERGDRAYRGERRLRGEAPAGPTPTLPRCRPRWCAATRTSWRASSTSPTTSSTARSSGLPTSCATTATIPTSSWRPTRARPRSPISPTASPPPTATGWVTRSRQAAARATTTR